MSFATEINNAIAAAKDMIAKYNELEMQYHSIDMMEQRDEWLRLYRQAKAIEPKIKRSIRTIARKLDFTIKPHEFQSLISTWENTLRRIEFRWKASQKALHTLEWWYENEYIENV